MRAALHRWLVWSYVAVAVAGAAWTRFRRARHRRRAVAELDASPWL